MEDPVRDLPDIVHNLTTSSPAKQQRTLTRYFLPSARFVHPLCYVPSFPGRPCSRDAILAVYRWYKLLSPWIGLRIEGVAWREWDEPAPQQHRRRSHKSKGKQRQQQQEQQPAAKRKGKAYIDAVQEMRYWFVPYTLRVRLCAVVECELLPAGANRGAVGDGGYGIAEEIPLGYVDVTGSEQEESVGQHQQQPAAGRGDRPSYAAVANPRVPTHEAGTQFTTTDDDDYDNHTATHDDDEDSHVRSSSLSNDDHHQQDKCLWYITSQTDYYQPEHFLDFLPVVGHLLRIWVLATRVFASVASMLGTAFFISIGWLVVWIAEWVAVLVPAVEEYIPSDGATADRALEVVLRFVARWGFGGGSTKGRGRGAFGGVLEQEDDDDAHNRHRRRRRHGSSSSKRKSRGSTTKKSSGRSGERNSQKKGASEKVERFINGLADVQVKVEQYENSEFKGPGDAEEKRGDARAGAGGENDEKGDGHDADGIVAGHAKGQVLWGLASGEAEGVVVGEVE